MILSFKDHHPDIDQSVYISKTATVTGNVKIGADSSVWPGSVIRGDVSPTIIGHKVNIQDLSVLHQSPDLPLVIEDEVTVGHQVTLHSCTIRKNALIGMGSIILDGAEVGEGAFIGAGSLVPPGKKIPAGMMAFGRPAKVVREVTEADRTDMQRIVREYAEKAQYYKQEEEKKRSGDDA
ncbi:gamma carbonic anhydrase [Jeotgalibacillus terrae]|uniref:Gamma carbonic anhydrase family protein n=1 Tax=Jeotgalibacillus terrae TaxID=587735 RepID=A0ABW5ZL91_9BACL|nr:gamma carbonic anhydrase family protein [Jeotgalibacillus terrae]MBM7579014.1 carbonic anhydrase/acetyltransferase-like protein (isoleucine patch superfamily) [Jeotgalibacillus terrae]